MSPVRFLVVPQNQRVAYCNSLLLFSPQFFRFMAFDRIDYNPNKLTASILLIVFVFIVSSIVYYEVGTLIGTLLHPEWHIHQHYECVCDQPRFMTESEANVFTTTYVILILLGSYLVLHLAKLSTWSKIIVMSILLIILLLFIPAFHSFLYQAPIS